jgi:GTPase Era involved in 16S rRNA processing
MASATPCAIILLGNSGVGKSFLANRLLNDDRAFESRFSARSVTRQTEWKNYVTSDGSTEYLVANIPGLIESNQKFIDENRTEIMKAFEQHPWAIVLFIFGHKNGRIPDEDIVAFTRINNAYQFPPQSLLIIVNGIPSDQFEMYEEKTKQLLHEITGVDDSHIYLIKTVTTDEAKMNIHRQLHQAIAKCKPVIHTRKHNIELLVEEISRLKMESRQLQDQLLTQERHRRKSESSPDMYERLHQSQFVFDEQISAFNNKIKQMDESIEAIEAKNKLFMAKYNEQQQKSDRQTVTESAQRLIDYSERTKSELPNIHPFPPQGNFNTKKSRFHRSKSKTQETENPSYYTTEFVNPSDCSIPYQNVSFVQNNYYCYPSDSIDDQSSYF